MTAIYTTYTVTFEIIGATPDTREFESLWDARNAYDEIELDYEYRKIYNTAGWRAAQGMILAKSLSERFYDEDDNELDVPYDPLQYEEYDINEYMAEED